ncbi:Ras-related protein Rab-32A [Diplonema papillatum]|nr:Ras-related protein Rab-32A [Diplonema papillatum]
MTMTGGKLTPVGRWLREHNLDEYAQSLGGEGYDDIEDLVSLVRDDEKTFHALVPKVGHQRKIARLLEESLGPSPPSSLARRTGSSTTGSYSDSQPPDPESPEPRKGTAQQHPKAADYPAAPRASTSIPRAPATVRPSQDRSAGASPQELGRFKVIVVGDAGTGKTSFIHQLVHSRFSPATKATIGLDWREKQFFVAGGYITVQYWDISGQERYANVTRAYYRGAHGALVCFDRSKPESMATVQKWKADIDSKVFLGDGADGVVIPCVLLANKMDLVKPSKEQTEEVATVAREHGFVQYFETSSRLNANVSEAAEYLTNVMRDNSDVHAMPMAIGAGTTSINNGENAGATSKKPVRRRKKCFF